MSIDNRPGTDPMRLCSGQKRGLWEDVNGSTDGLREMQLGLAAVLERFL